MSRGSAITFSVDDDEPLIRHVTRQKGPRARGMSVYLPVLVVGKEKKPVGVKPSSTKTAKKVVKRKLTNVLRSESSEEY